ncbi:MAG: phage/plasmid primase, P4 family [Pseudomonadota bacterium]
MRRERGASIHQTVRQYLRQGFAPIPVERRGKRPVGSGWQHIRVKDSTIQRVFEPKMNVGVLMGEASGGLTDVDLDCKEARLAASRFLPETAAQFGRKSAERSHLLYLTELWKGDYPASIRFADPAETDKSKATLLELRTGCKGGAQTVFPGSIHQDTGEAIRWDEHGEPSRVDGEELLRVCKVLAAAALLARYWPGPGDRQEARMAVYGVLKRAGWADRYCANFVTAVTRATGQERRYRQGTSDAASTERALKAGRTVYGVPKLRKIVGREVADQVCEWLELDSGEYQSDGGPPDNQQISDKNIRVPRSARGKGSKQSEDQIAAQFAEQHEDKFLYDHILGAWYVWKGYRWDVDRRKVIIEDIRAIIRAFLGASPADGRSMGSSRFIGGVEKLARSDKRLAVDQSQWDSDVLLAGVPHGTLDLRTGIVRPPDPHDRITKTLLVAPADQATCPRFLAFLHEALGGDAQMIDALQRLAGYFLTGDTSEHRMVFLYGTGGNGKSVLVSVLSEILNDYATTAGMETLTASSFDRHPTELAVLRGARLVTAVETEEGRSLAESRIKSLTGGDEITARFMRQDPFTFKPQLKLLIAGNHQPRLTNVDEAMRRRIWIFPFVITPRRKDRYLLDKLREEYPSILRWMIEGALKWQADGLIEPPSVTRETAEYFSRQDLFQSWLDECCTVDVSDPALWASTEELLSELNSYLRDNGEPSQSAIGLSGLMRSKGFKHKKRTRGGAEKRGYNGIAIMEKPPEPGPLSRGRRRGRRGETP